MPLPEDFDDEDVKWRREVRRMRRREERGDVVLTWCLWALVIAFAVGVGVLSSYLRWLEIQWWSK